MVDTLSDPVSTAHITRGGIETNNERIQNEGRVKSTGTLAFNALC